MDSELLTDQSLQTLANQCPNLRWLDLNSNRFTDQGVAYLANAKKMEMLWLRSTSLTDDCIKSVSGLVHLRHLELTVATIDDDCVRTLVRLPVLEILALEQFSNRCSE
jgi:Ran GTPase-activating protein (RanGAP) involved in mRNA processing and transport